MTAPLDLAALRALLDGKATRRPWTLVEDGGVGVAEIATVYNTHSEQGYSLIAGDRVFSESLKDVRTADAALIVAAVNALPALLDELEALRAARIAEQRRQRDAV